MKTPDGMIAREALSARGFVMLAPIDSRTLEAIRDCTHEIHSDDRRGGLRDPQLHIDGLAQLVDQAGMHRFASELLGTEALAVRWILFDKTPEANWLVPWHRDTTICVRERVDLNGYGPWSVKDGRVHVQPPLEVLQAMVTLRLHIDDADRCNGALRVRPGSHHCRTLDEESEHTDEEFAEARAGEILAMNPLLVHASSKASSPSRRRVLHIEYAASPLQEPLAWA